MISYSLLEKFLDLLWFWKILSERFFVTEPVSFLVLFNNTLATYSSDCYLMIISKSILSVRLLPLNQWVFLFGRTPLLLCFLTKLKNMKRNSENINFWVLKNMLAHNSLYKKILILEIWNLFSTMELCGFVGLKVFHLWKLYDKKFWLFRDVSFEIFKYFFLESTCY